MRWSRSFYKLTDEEIRIVEDATKTVEELQEGEA